MNIETFFKGVIDNINKQAKEKNRDPIDILFIDVEISCDLCPLQSLCSKDPDERGCHDFLKDHLTK